jgi:hypothetical protein
MVNYLKNLKNSPINFAKIFEVIRDFYMGGLNSVNYVFFIQIAESYPPIRMRNPL